MCFNMFLDIFSIAQFEVLLLWLSADVPEGCVIIREHIAITNLFTCLWFNEVDRFTSRDQLSFSTVRDKIMGKVSWSINMFMDCERRNFVIQVWIFSYCMCCIGCLYHLSLLCFISNSRHFETEIYFFINSGITSMSLKPLSHKA